MFHSKQDVDRHVNEVFRNIKSEYQRNSKCYQIAKLYYKFKDYKSAIKYINRYILTTTNSAAAHRLLGECYLGVNLKEKALDSFKTSLDLNGNQNDLVLKICSLLMDPDVSVESSRATYWLERAEVLFSTNPVVFQLREHILKANLDGKQDVGQLEKLILSEISARPADVTVRIRLLNFFIDTKRYKIAYQHALEIEERNFFSNDLRWYDCLCNVFQAYEKATSGHEFSFFIKKIIFFEKRADLSMQEFQEEVKTLPECSAALFAFDQNLHSVSKIEVPQDEKSFFAEFMKHMKAQLSFHLATLALKRAKKEFGIWPKAFCMASPLLLQATQNTMDLEEVSYSIRNGKNKIEKEVKQLNRSASFRISQAGHILLAWSQSKGPKFLEKVSQFCGGKWQNHVYQDVFYNKEHQQAMNTSHFINDPFFSHVPMKLLTDTELSHFDEVSQFAYPDSLHHQIWLGLSYCNANGYLSHDFRCTIVPDLQFTVVNLSQTGPETLNQLDVDAFLYASVLCARSAIPNIVSSDRPNRLPVSISEELCSPAQADWWLSVYKIYTNQTAENIADMRLKLRKGIEVIRVFGQHGLHVKIIVMLAKLFQERAIKNKNPTEVSGLENRAYSYWTAAIPLLEKLVKNQHLREVPNRLFDYRGKELTPNEIKAFLEEGKLFLACRLMKLGRHEQAIEAFQSLKSPYATFYQALIYEKLASEEINHSPETITSENRSQHIILLTRARDALYLTLDRLRCPSVEPNHPLNAQLQDHLDQIEKQLAVIDSDNNLNRNGDSQSDETDTAPGPLSPDVDENLESSFNVYNTTNILSIKNHSSSRNFRQNLLERHHTARFEARPSPERLDAQLRHLVQANSSGLQAIVEQLKEMKSTVLIELKDLGCVTRDLLAEMKRWNDRLETMSKRTTDLLKPEDLFELREEDYEDISQLSQPYASYQNYPLNRQITGTQGTSTVTYGTSVSSPVPAVPPVVPVIPTPENPLIPSSFYPGAHPVPPIDPSLLLYQSLGYYAPGMPYGENQNVSEYRGAGIHKGVPFAKTSFKVPDAISTTTVLSNKPQPPNVVITSSDTLPAFTSAGMPAMSVTVPPQHIRGLAPSAIQKPSQVHPFQIQMPPQAQLVKESPTEKLNSLTPISSASTGVIQTSALVSGVKPTPVEQSLPLQETGQTKLVSLIKKAPEGKVVMEQMSKENKLFESSGTLSVFDKQWKSEGLVFIKILQNKQFGKARILILEEPSRTKVYADHCITPFTRIEPSSSANFGWVCTMWGVQKKFLIQFNTLDEFKDFEFAFNEARGITEQKVQNAAHKLTPSKEVNVKQCLDCKARVEDTAEKCSACESKTKSVDKTNFGGFTFTSSPIVKPSLKLTEETEKSKEQPKPSPFAEFSFSSTTLTPSNTDSQPKDTTPKLLSACNTTTADNFNFFAGVKADPNSFTKKANFKGFEGKDSLVFGHLNKTKTSDTKLSVQKPASKITKNDEENEGEEDFVPTAEFKPVVDLPDLIDVKTGEENDKVLYDERAKLLRFDTTLKEWKERGVGQMRVLLNEETGKVRLIMRRELVLKVCCNHYLDEKMEFKRMMKSERALTWYAQDYSEGEIKAELLALKFMNIESMVRFETAISNARSIIKSNRVENSEQKEIEEKKLTEFKPLSELFKPKPGSWECGACLVINVETAVKCVSCTTPKPGSSTLATDVPVSTTNTLEKGIITFSPATTKYSFGFPQPTSTTSTYTTPVTFSFGIPQTTASSTNSTGFNLGVNLNTSASSETTKSSLPTKYTFGIPQTNTTKSDVLISKMKLETTSPSQTLNSTSNWAPNTQANTSATASLSFSSPRFTFSLPNTSTSKNEAPNILGNELLNFNVSKTIENESKTPVSAQSTFSLMPSSLKTDGKDKFAFSLSNIKPVVAKTTSPKLKSEKKVSGNKATSEDSEEEVENEEDNEDHVTVKPLVPLPDKVALHTGEEEEDVMYERRAKLYRFMDKEWKERGIGMIKILKHKTNNKLRLLMRRETILKVCLNHYLTPDIEFKVKDDKTWTWTAADFSEEEVRYRMFAIRFKTPEFAQEFKKVLDDVKNNVASSPHKFDLTEKSKEPSAVMKNFTFAVPNPSKTELSKGFQSGTSDDDILVVYENKVTPEQREKAMSLNLPPNFYAYLQAPDCPGCPGCDKDDAPAECLPKEPSSKSVFGTIPWKGFGQDENSKNKVLFTFAGNQGPINWGLVPKVNQTASKATQEEVEREDLKENDEHEENYEDEVLDEEEKEYEDNEDEDDDEDVDDDEDEDDDDDDEEEEDDDHDDDDDDDHDHDHDDDEDDDDDDDDVDDDDDDDDDDGNEQETNKMKSALFKK